MLMWLPLFAFAVLFLFYGFRPLTLWKLRHIPGPTPFWLLGNLPTIVKLGKHAAFAQWAKRYGSVYKVLEGGVPTVVIQDPELAKWVNSRMPNRHPIPYMETGEEERFNAAGILFARNAHHRGLRAAWQPMFHSSSLREFTGLMVQEVQRVASQLTQAANEDRTVDIWRLFGGFTIQVSGQTAFGVELKGELASSAKAFFDAAGRIENIYALLQLAFPSLAPLVRQLATAFPTQDYKQALEGRKYVRATVSALLAESKEHPQKLQRPSGVTKDGLATAPAVGPIAGSFLSLMAKSINKETGQPFSDMEVVCQAFSFVLAAYETTTASLAFAVYLLSMHPQKQAAMLREIDAYGRGKIPAYEDLNKFPYVEAVFKETLRLYPPVPLTIREAERDISLGGFNIPAGTHLAVSMYGLHHSSKYWKDAEAFLPERFLPGGEGVDAAAYMPFGEGPRGCIGQRYAWQEAMIALVVLYQKFVFELEPGQVPLPVRMSLSLGPKEGVRVRVIPRN